MSIKRFCDVCGEEVNRNVASDRISGSPIYRGKKVQVEIMAGVGAAMNAGDLCASCLFGVLDRFDPRPKAGEAA